MAIKSLEITNEECDKILKSREGHFIDLKSVDIQPAKLTRTISAFANADGGELYIGIDEERKGRKKSRQWNGFPDEEAANGHIQIFEKLYPFDQWFEYCFLYSSNNYGLVFKIEVRKTRDIFLASNEIPYLRRGAQNIPINTDDQLHRLKINKGITSYETETVSVNPSVIYKSKVTLDFIKNVVPLTDAKSWLLKQNLIIGNKPTVAAILLFAEEPQIYLPKRCSIKIVQYRTRAKDGMRPTLSFQPITIEGCLYNSIQQAVKETVSIVENVPMLSPTGLKVILYPRVTLHEIITNAVLHRDYSIATDIQVRIYDNRIEVHSPGTLPAHITTQNILYQQFARNPVIVRLINKFPDPPNKDIGEGLRTAFNAMTKLKLKSPTIKENENSVVVRIRHEPLASPEEIIMSYLTTRFEITNFKARQLTGIESGDAMKQVFYRLKSRNLIESVPGKYGTRASWRKPNIQLKLPFNS
jgi:ATP-dependent DNA helicase RecG